MSKTKRYYKDGMCLRSQKNKPQKVEKTMVKDVSKDAQVNIKNLNEVPEPWDDKCVASLYETKHIWKNGLEIKKADDDCYDIYFGSNFICNLDKQQLMFFPWTIYLPLEQPPNLDNFVLV